ncbi:MAG TPA: EamA family transporter [Chloroflexota bacterium]|nr:EamA family transporter [Chloroflexota bacterium]
MRPRQFIMLIVLAAIWGASYLFIRVASPVLGPFPLMELRTILAGLVLWVYASASGRRPELRANWRRFLALGVLNGALPFALIASAELYLPASLAAILNATTPLFTALVAAGYGVEQLTRRRMLGIAIGFGGVAILVGWSPIPLTGQVVFGAVTSLLGALCYGLGGTYASRTFKDVPPLTMATAQQLGAAAALLPFALGALPEARVSGDALANMLALALLSTVVAYLIYYPLLKSVGPTRTLSVTFLIPVFGILWGALFLHEKIGPGTLVGLLVILSSVTLVTGVRLGKRTAKAPETAL